MVNSFFPQEIIKNKRDGNILTNKEIEFFIRGITDKTLQESQIAAFAMAIFFQGMNKSETVSLTKSMLNSGIKLDWSKSNLNGPIVDKHSTGGVGDKVSIILAPLLAACGCYVPMISGRGLGHTGGTLDKLDSIKEYNSQPNLEKFTRTVEQVGCAIIGQTSDLAPADGTLYSIRDITATVESIPLITASILSKKLAAGLEHLVMDIKTGNGAFASDIKIAIELAKTISMVANDSGVKCTSLITDMNQVLGKTAGNEIEILEVIEHLTNKKIDKRLFDVTIALSAELLLSSKISKNIESAKSMLLESIENGKAAEKFSQMVYQLGGPIDLIEKPNKYLNNSSKEIDIFHQIPGYVSEINTRNLGLVIMQLGGGRKKSSDKIDHSVGLKNIASLGEYVDKNKPICTILNNKDDDNLIEIKTKIINSFKIIENKNQDYLTNSLFYEKF